MAINDFIEKNKKIITIFSLCITVFLALFAMWTFTGKFPWNYNGYNTYILQANAWKDGHLDLGQDYPALELAIYGGKYYVSFPPLPSILMFPFVLFGWEKCDGFLMLVSALAAAVYAFLLMNKFCKSEKVSFFFALFLTLGSNWLFTAQAPYVWFIAQNMAFTFGLMAIYYAVSDKPALSLFFWALAIGCRPLQFLYLPVLLFIIYENCKKKTEKKKNKKAESPFSCMMKRWKCVIPMAIVALVYMILNYARFDSIFEFGHNYLQEFTRTTAGQFNFVYLKDNLPKLFLLPKMKLHEPWEYPGFEGMNIFYISPIFISYIAYSIKMFVKGTKSDKKLVVIAFIMISLELVATAMHRTMGGSHFGNRYTNDVLPMVFLPIAMTAKGESVWSKLNVALFVFGFVVNVIGTFMWYAQ